MKVTERNAKRIEKMIPKSEKESEPVIVKVIKMYDDDEIAITYLVPDGEISEAEFHRRYPDYEEEPGPVSVNWDE